MSKTISIAELRQRAAALPRVPLTPLPTPLEECPRLAEAVGGGVRIFLKRDDLISLGFGGNKVRKLEFSLGAARAAGCDVLVNALAGQSNYCRQTAAAAAKAGLRCVLVLRRDHKTEDPPQANRLLDYIYGAEVQMVADAPAQSAAMKAAVERLKAEGHKPYVVGHHDEVVGGVAYALCLAEILEQSAAAGVKPDWVFVTGRTGTTGGLNLGKRLLGFTGKVQSFNCSPHDEAVTRTYQGDLVRSATEAAGMLGLAEMFAPGDFSISAEYGGPAYGTPSEACLDALLLLGRTEGIAVGPVYVAKGLSGVLDWIRTGKVARGQSVVFIHTGGTPEVFAYNREIMERFTAQGRV